MYITLVVTNEIAIYDVCIKESVLLTSEAMVLPPHHAGNVHKLNNNHV